MVYPGHFYDWFSRGVICPFKGVPGIVEHHSLSSCVFRNSMYGVRKCSLKLIAAIGLWSSSDLDLISQIVRLESAAPCSVSTPIHCWNIGSLHHLAASVQSGPPLGLLGCGKRSKSLTSGAMAHGVSTDGNILQNSAASLGSMCTVTAIVPSTNCLAVRFVPAMAVMV